MEQSYSKRELKLGVRLKDFSFNFRMQDYHDTKYLKSKKLLIKIRFIYKEKNE